MSVTVTCNGSPYGLDNGACGVPPVGVIVEAAPAWMLKRLLVAEAILPTRPAAMLPPPDAKIRERRQTGDVVTCAATVRPTMGLIRTHLQRTRTSLLRLIAETI